MGNNLKVEMIDTIKILLLQGWSRRQIARELGIDRKTVNRYALRFSRNYSEEQTSNPKRAISTSGNPTFGEDPKRAISTPGSPGRKSLCELHRGYIEPRALQGLTAQRIYQDLVYDHDFKGSYQSVKRFVRKFSRKHDLPFRRIECDPGMEAQVDFGRGAPVTQANGRKRFPHIFRVVLSNSRKAYSEVVYHQSTENFIRALENSFRHFGGVPRTIIIDNLRAAVKKPDWFDPELNPKVVDFCRHYGTVILPHRPYAPRHKGKVERSVGYVKENALKGRIFSNLREQNIFLLYWEENVADKRIHGTTKEQVAVSFEKEKPFLRKLPDSLFPCFEEGGRKVHRDGYVEVARSYYSVPYEYRQREVWARWDLRTVRIFSLHHLQIAIHPRVEPGKFSEIPGHIPPEKISGAEKGADYLIQRASYIGPNSEGWARALLKNRGFQGYRVLQGFLQMPGKYSISAIEEACLKALSYGAFRLKDLRSLIKRQPVQTEFEFMERHPLIRDISDYGELCPFGNDLKNQNLTSEKEVMPTENIEY